VKPENVKGNEGLILGGFPTSISSGNILEIHVPSSSSVSPEFDHAYEATAVAALKALTFN